MSQRTFFICDRCQKEIGKKKHISLVLDLRGMSCGVAVPPDPKKGGRWRVEEFKKSFIHFCSGTCAGQYFGELIKNAK